MGNKIIKYAVIDAVLTALYIATVSFFLFYGSLFFGPMQSKGILAPITMLSLLVFSASLTGILVFGRPAIWFLDGRKKEAVYLLLWTLAAFVLMTIAILIAFYFIF